MLKAIIFDVDGTLAETEELHRIAFNHAFVDAGLPWHWTREHYRRLLDISGGKEPIRHFVESEALPEADRDDLGEYIARLHKAKTAIYTQLVDDGKAELRPGVRRLVESARARGVRLAIATTTSLPNVDALLASAFGNRHGVFELICAGDSVPAKKPAPDIYLDALRRLDLPATECVAIEDSRNGLLAAHAAGIPTLVTPGIYTDDQDFAEALGVLPDLAGLGDGDPVAVLAKSIQVAYLAASLESGAAG